MRQRDRNKKRRIERQEEATARQATYDGLTTVQKFARFHGDVNGREGSRLTELLNGDTGRALQAVRLA